MKNKILFFQIAVTISLTSAFSVNAIAQKTTNIIAESESPAEVSKLDWMASLENVRIKYGASQEDFSTFERFQFNALESIHRKLFKDFEKTKADSSFLSESIKEAETSVSALYENFLNTKKLYPSTVAEFTHSNFRPASNPCDSVACDNINFNEGTFNGWYGYWAANYSNTSFQIVDITGGALGSVTKACNDTNSMWYMNNSTYCTVNTEHLTNDYQITLTSGGNDFVVPSIPRVSPWATGGHSVMLGDSDLTESGVAILTKTFLVTAATDNFTYQYAVLLMNPSHTYYQQPFFSVLVLDDNGDTLPNCGQYNVVSGYSVSGYDSLNFNGICGYTNTKVYYKNWTLVNVPLKKYIGHCVTVEFEAADCSPGAHFGYAYINASCGQLAITSSAPVICGNNAVTLTGPAGETGYKWSGPAGGITSSTTTQTVTVDAAGTYTLVVTPVTGALCKDTLTFSINKDIISTTISNTNISCNGGTGSATVSATGGAAPYTYSWSPSGGTGAMGSGLTAGTYTITITDNIGCSPSAAVTVVITQPAKLTATMGTPSDPSCGGQTGSATVSVTGGTTPYTYSWSPSGGNGATGNGLTAGTYTVTVSDNHGCSSTASVTITQPTTITASIAASTYPLCNGQKGTATASVTGGTTPYTYSWSPSGGNGATGTGLSAGTYTVLVSDNHGCSSTASVTITQPTTITASIAAPTYPSCHGGTGSATASVTGGTGAYTYSWSPSGGNSAIGTSLTAGTYTFTVTDNHGCSSTTSVIITQPALLTASTSFVPASCNLNNGSANVSVTGGTIPYTYLWSVSASGQTTATATGVSAGTYTVTMTDKDGCNTTATVTVTQPSAVTATISGSTPVNCNGNNNGTATTIVTGGTSPYTYTWSTSPSQTTSNASSLSAGTYTLTVKDNNGCINSVTVTITQPAFSISASVNASANVSCNGLSNGSAISTVSGGTPPYTYSWSGGAGTNANTSNLSAGTYTLTVTDNHGCFTNTATVTITQPASSLSASASASENVSCNGLNNGSATSTVSGGTTPYTYSWSGGAGTSANASNLSAGTYTLTVTDNHGCFTNTATVTITQPTSSLSASANASENVSCNGLNNGNATSTVSGGTTPYTYSWSGGAGTSANASNLSAGTYTLTVIDNHGCFTNTATVTITQPASSLSASANASENVSCNGLNNGSATSTVSGGTTPYTYSWSGGAGTSANASNLSAGTYTLTVIDNHGCFTNTATVTITQPASSLSASASASENVSCNGLNNGSATSTVSGGTTPYTYSWSGGAGTNANVSGLSAGTYTLTVTDNHGCFTNTATVTITQPTSSLSASASASENVSCNGLNNGSATSTVSGGTTPYTYSWSGGAGTNANASSLSAGTYTLTVTDNHGCFTNTVTVIITQPASSLSASASASENVSCNGLNNGSATSSVSGGTAPYTYSWSGGAGTNANVSGLSAGTYTVTVTDNHGCFTNTATVTITQPVVLTASLSDIIYPSCNGETGSATVISTGGSLPYTYLWTNSSSSASADVTAGTYTATVTDNNGCTATTSIIITQPLLLTAIMGTPQNASCNTANGSIPVSATGGTLPYKYSWAPSGGSTDTATGLSAGTYTVTVTDSNDCTVTTTATIIGKSIAITVCCPATIIQGNNVTLVAKGDSIKSYTWTPSASLNCDTCASVIATPTVTTTYTVFAIDSSGCQTEEYVTINVEIPCFDPIIPNVFTPTNSGSLGLDNVFYIKTTNLDSWALHIFDRWGVELFNTTNQYQYWDGNTKSGSKAPAGVYDYVIEATCQGNTYKKGGFVQLIR